VCRTDLHVLDGELTGRPLPIIPGHEIVGRIDASTEMPVLALEPLSGSD
jgi:propanol-preferring alcohol dehydrogenase